MSKANRCCGKLIGTWSARRLPPPLPPPSPPCRHARRRSTDGHGNVAEATAPGRPTQPGGHHSHLTTPSQHHERQDESLKAYMPTAMLQHRLHIPLSHSS
eukprot:scaffold17639_cov30-Tisochrysis_lutea.AAC.1